MSANLQQQWLYRPVALHVCSVGQYSAQEISVIRLRSTQGIASNSVTALQVQYMPIAIPARFTIARFMMSNGGTVSGNVDVGLYSASGSKLISTGTTARAGSTNSIQYIDVTNQSFLPGVYYLAMVLSGGNALTTSTGVAASSRMVGGLQETIGGLPLPSSMTPVAATFTRLTYFGFTQSDTL